MQVTLTEEKKQEPTSIHIDLDTRLETEIFSSKAISPEGSNRVKLTRKIS